MSQEGKSENTYIIIKGRFRAISSSSFGLFIVFLDNITKNVDKYDIVSSHFSTIYENNINMPWYELEQIISKLKWKGEYATSLTHDIQACFEDLFQVGTGRAQDIWSNIKKAQLEKVASIFDEVLARPTSDKSIKSEVSIETIAKTEIEEIKRNRRERESKDILSSTYTPPEEEIPSIPKVEESAVVLEVSLVLSPISGTPIYDLKENDKVFIKISEQSSRGQYFIDLLGASENNEIIPIPADVVRMSKEGKIYTVLVRIGPGIYGKSFDEDTVKVKMYDPAQDRRLKKQQALQTLSTPEPEPVVSEKDKKVKKRETLNIIFVIIGLMAILMLIIIIYLFL